MHFEQQDQVITESDGKTSFVFELVDFLHPPANQLFKQVYAVSSGSVKSIRKRKA
jgi:hypothetical protein